MGNFTYQQTLGAAGGSSQIPSSIAIPYNDPRIRYRGGATAVTTTYPIYVYGTGITYTLAEPMYEVEFMYDGRMLEFRQHGNGGPFVPLINNYLLNGMADTASLPADGKLYYRLLDFGQRQIRRIRVRTNRIMEVRIEPDATIWPVPEPLPPRAIVLGDSYTEGAQGGGWNNFCVYLSLLANLDVWASGEGGTGILNNGATSGDITTGYGPYNKQKFRDRIPTDVAPYNPDYVIIAGGINDRTPLYNGTITVSQFRQEYDALIAACKGITSVKKVICLGPFFPKDSDTWITQIRDQIKASAQAAGCPFIDPLGYFTNANKPRYISADNTHPTEEGYAYLAKRLAPELIRALGTEA